MIMQTESQNEQKYDYYADDVIYDVVFFFLTAIGAFGWMMIMLLIISFVTLSYLQFHIKGMIKASILFAVLAVIWYVIKMVRKYHGKSVCFRIGSRRK